MITVVVFDLDDTLYDEVDYCRSGFIAVAGYLADSPGAPSAEDVYAALWAQFSAGNRTRTFNAALDALGLDCDQSRVQELVQVYRNHAPRITLPDESRAVLDKLKSKYTLVLLTDGFMPAQRLKVQVLGIEEYFARIVYTEQLGRQFWKPSPAGFEKLMRDLDVSPEQAVYVADNEKKDFIAPNKLGFSTIRLIRSGGIHTAVSDKPGAKAQHEIRRLGELPTLIERL